MKIPYTERKLIEVQNLDYGTLQEFLKNNGMTNTLIGFIETEEKVLGDWDFGLRYPYFEGPRIPPGAKAPQTFWDDRLGFYEERIIRAWVALGEDEKPVRLVIYGERKVDGVWRQKWVCFYFNGWDEEYIYTIPEE